MEKGNNQQRKAPIWRYLCIWGIFAFGQILIWGLPLWIFGQDDGSTTDPMSYLWPICLFASVGILIFAIIGHIIIAKRYKKNASTTTPTTPDTPTYVPPPKGVRESDTIISDDVIKIR